MKNLKALTWTDPYGLNAANAQVFLYFVRAVDDEGYEFRYFGQPQFQPPARRPHPRRAASRHQWPAGMARAYTGRKKVRKQDAVAIEVEGSKSAHGSGHAAASLLAYLSTLALDAGKLPPPYETWLSMRDQ